MTQITPKRKGKVAYPKVKNIAKTRAELLYPKENYVDYSNWNEDVKKVDSNKILDFTGDVYFNTNDKD